MCPLSGDVSKPAERAPQSPIREEFDRRYLLLGTVPLAVYLIFYLILAETRNTGITFETIGTAEFAAVAHGEAKFRYLWVSAFWLFGTVSLAVIVSCAFSLYHEIPRQHRLFVLSLVVFLSVAIIGFEIVATDQSGRCWYDNMGRDLFRTTLGNMPVSIAKSGIPEGGLEHADSILSKLDMAIDTAKFLAAIALIVIGLGSILTLTRPVAGKEGAPQPSEERQTQYLADKVAVLKAYLYQGTAVFVFAVVAMMSWMFWPIDFLAGADVQAAYRDLLVGSAVLQGVGYTVGVASIYLPPAVMLRQRIRRIARQVATSDDGASVEQWLRARRLHFQPLDELRQMGAILLPALVSGVPALMNF